MATTSGGKTAPTGGGTGTVSQAVIANAFLRELGAPQTPVMTRAVIAWMRAESGTTIRANNPWNMTLAAARETGIPTCGSWTSMSSGLTFAAFCSPQDGARASARLLLNAGHDWRHYDAVVAGARSGNPLTFLNALAHSAWDGGRYGTKNGGPNKLIAIYNSLPGISGFSTLVDPGLTNPASGNQTPQNIGGSYPTIPSLGGWDNIVSFPVNHPLTAADVDLIMAQLASHGYFANDTTGAAQSVTRSILNSHIGDPWNKALQDKLQAEFGTAAGNAIPKPLDALGSIAGSFTQILAALFDPHKWLLFLGLLTGAFLTAYGGINVLSAAR